MGINIKNEETQRLIKALADLTGETQTAAVTAAVRERLERLESEKSRKGMAERIMAIARETGPLLKGMPDIDSLYDYLDEEIEAFKRDRR